MNTAIEKIKVSLTPPESTAVGWYNPQTNELSFFANGQWQSSGGGSMPDDIALESTSQEIKSAVNGQAQDLETLAQNYASIEETINGIISKARLPLTVEGIEQQATLSSYPTNTSPLSLMLRANLVIEVDDNTMVNTNELSWGSFTGLKKVTLRKAETLSGFRSMTAIEEVIAPKANQIVGSFRFMTNLKVFHMPEFDICNNDPTSVEGFRDCPKVIDLTIGAALTAHALSQSYTRTWITTWDPDEALLDNDDTLLTDEDIAAGFTSNREKLLWNIRNHIAALLNPSETATITFSADVYNAIAADQDTMDAFPASWTIAHV